MLNHNCENNSCFWTENSRINVASFKKIKKGETISVSYITETYRPKNIRDKELSFRGFDCLCSRCKNDPEKVRVFLANCCTNSFLI